MAARPQPDQLLEHLPDATPGAGAIRPVVSFRALISPPIIVLAIPALVVCAVRALRRRPASQSPADVGIAVLAVAWFLGMWVPFELQSALDHRISYLYYMVVVMPGIYLAVTYLAALLWRQRRTWLRGLVALWALAVLAAAVLMFPGRQWSADMGSSGSPSCGFRMENRVRPVPGPRTVRV